MGGRRYLVSTSCASRDVLFRVFGTPWDFALAES